MERRRRWKPLGWSFAPHRLVGDLYGGVTAAIVALPLALAFGVASGLGAQAGVYGAILAGFFASLFGGTRSQITGPTGPMTVLMALVVTRHAGQPAEALTVVMMAGAFQVLFGTLGLGKYVTYMPYKVISGFMSGIGVLIIALQLAPLTGYDQPVSNAVEAVSALPAMINTMQPHALVVGLLSFSVAMFWPRPLRRFFPSPLAGLLAGSAVGVFIWTDVAIIGAIPQSLPHPVIPQWNPELLGAMLKSALALALLGSIDSLLTSLVADNMTDEQHDANRELVGQGIGNSIAGLFGGIPGAGATVRTVVNIGAGGRTPVSGMIHAMLLFGMLVGLAPLAQHIPLAALAGLLLKVGIDIIDWDYLRRMRGAPKEAMAVMLVVLFATVFIDLITAVAAGLIMTSLISARAMSEAQLEKLHLVSSDDAASHLDAEERALLREADKKVLVLHMSGPFSFGSATAMIRRLATSGTDYQSLILDFSDVSLVDASIAMAIRQIVDRALGSNKSVHIVLGPERTQRLLDQMRALVRVPTSQRHADRKSAIEAAIRTQSAGTNS